MADKLEIRRLKVLPAVLAPSTLYITRTVGNTKLVDITVTGDTIAEVRKTLGVVETTEIINTILETYVPARALKADNADNATRATTANSANTAVSAETAETANTATRATIATSAEKLSKKVTVRLAGDVTGSAQWDGSTDLTINTTGGGSGPSPVNLPIVFYSDDFINMNEEEDEQLVVDGTPVQTSTVSGLTYNHDTVGGYKTSMGLMVHPGTESQAAQVSFEVEQEGVDTNYFGNMLFRAEFNLSPDIYTTRARVPIRILFGKGYETNQIGGEFEFSLTVVTMGVVKFLRFKYGSLIRNEAILPLSSGSHKVTARLNGNTINIQVSQMPSDMETIWSFNIPSQELAPNLDWGSLKLEISQDCSVTKVEMLGI